MKWHFLLGLTSPSPTPGHLSIESEMQSNGPWRQTSFPYCCFSNIWRGEMGHGDGVSQYRCRITFTPDVFHELWNEVGWQGLVLMVVYFLRGPPSPRPVDRHRYRILVYILPWATWAVRAARAAGGWWWWLSVCNPFGKDRNRNRKCATQDVHAKIVICLESNSYSLRPFAGPTQL